MKNLLLIIVGIISVIVVFFTAGAMKSTGNNEKFEFQNITPAEAKERLAAEPGIILLDVRTPAEYAEKHIPDSKLIPLDQLEQEAEAKLKNKGATVFVYCRSGRRSAIAAGILVKLGYTDVYNLGGIIDWPYETESGN